MEHLREISKIAEWGLKGDKKRLVAYLDQLIEKVEKVDKYVYLNLNLDKEWLPKMIKTYNIPK